jgi:hypothetical protein
MVLEELLLDSSSFVLGIGNSCERVLNGSSPPRMEADRDANGRRPPSDLCSLADVWNDGSLLMNLGNGDVGTLATGILQLLL